MNNIRVLSVVLQRCPRLIHISVVQAITMAVSISLLVGYLINTSVYASGTIDLELNKVEQRESGCLLYLVAKNGANLSFENFKMDLVLFDEESLIIKRIAVNLAPLSNDKTSVKLFELSNAQCAEIGSVLVNDVLECVADADLPAHCVDLIISSSRDRIQLYK